MLMYRCLMKRHVLHRDGLLYSILFPIAYTLIYLLALSGVLGVNGEAPEFAPVPVAVTIQGDADEVGMAESVFEHVGILGEMQTQGMVVPETAEKRPFVYVLADEDTAAIYMKQGLIDAIIRVDNGDYEMDMEMELARKGVNNVSNTVLYHVMDAVQARSKEMKLLFEDHLRNLPPEDILQVADEMIAQQESLDFTSIANYVQKNEVVNSDQVYLFASMAYICMFFASTGVWITYENTAPYSPMALREDASPVPRSYRLFKTFVSWMILIGLVLLVVIGIYYARGFILWNKLSETILLMGVGTVVGLSFGAALGAIFPYKEKVAISISIALPLIWAAATGMMAGEFMRQIFTEKFPWFNQISPVALIHDGLYYLNYYPTKVQFHEVLLKLFIYAVALQALTFILTRRAEYENL